MLFQDLLEYDQGQNAHPLWIVESSTVSDWSDGREARHVAWVEEQGFKGLPGEVLTLPGADGKIAGALAGVSNVASLGPWDLAAAASKLPAGIYRIADPKIHGSLAYYGWLMAHYQFKRYHSEQQANRRRVLLIQDQSQGQNAIALAEATTLVRDLINTPANDMGPDELAAACKAVAEKFGATLTEIVGDDLLTSGFPTIHMVGRASAQPPRLIDIQWGNRDHPKVTLVGKGVCFDSGGLDIKPSSGMLLMKKDMGGAAHALALGQLIMQHKLPVQLRILLPIVENSISANAFRPGDIVRTRKGLTVEIGNTDAEGRLILCDALALADEDKPDLILNFATLTGAARVALGPDLPAVFTPDEHLAQALYDHANKVQDPLWRLPLWDPYANMLLSPIADINNASEKNFAGAITAALFLKRFVTTTSSWAHIDLYAWSPSSKPGRPQGAEAMTLRACWSLLSTRYAR